MKQSKKIALKPASGVSTPALRLARVALDISQRQAAIDCGVGWRTMQRLELDEPVALEIREKIKAEWERRGVMFLNTDAAGWGIRVPKRSPEGPFGHEAFKALRVGLGLSVKEAAGRAKVSTRELNVVESDDEAPAASRDKVKNAYVDAGVKLLTPGRGGWGFRIPETLSPERGRVLLMRPRRKAKIATADSGKPMPVVGTAGAETPSSGAKAETPEKTAAPTAKAPAAIKSPRAKSSKRAVKKAPAKSAKVAAATAATPVKSAPTKVVSARSTAAKKGKAAAAKGRKPAAPKAKK